MEDNIFNLVGFCLTKIVRKLVKLSHFKANKTADNISFFNISVLIHY